MQDFTNIYDSYKNKELTCGKAGRLLKVMKLILFQLITVFIHVYFIHPSYAITSEISKTNDVVVIERKNIDGYPDMIYPIVSGLSNSEVLKKVQEELSLERIWGSSIEEMIQHHGTKSMDYTINYNKNDILDITFTKDTVTAYYRNHIVYKTINLKNGDPLKAIDLFKPEMLPSLLGRLKNLQKKEFQQALFSLADSEDELNRYSRADLEEELLKREYKLIEDLDNFSINDQGVVFIYQYEFPNVILCYEPKGKFFLSYAQLKPYININGPLGLFVKP